MIIKSAALSTGDPSTLGSYLRLTKQVFGEKSSAVVFLNKKIAESPNCEAEEVITDESQMLYLFMHINAGKAE